NPAPRILCNTARARLSSRYALPRRQTPRAAGERSEPVRRFPNELPTLVGCSALLGRLLVLVDRASSPHSPNTTEIPGNAMQSRTVLQVSPLRIGSATVNVPVVTSSPACNALACGCFASSAIKCAAASSGLPSTLEPHPVSRTLPSHDKRDREALETRYNIAPDPLDALRFAHEQRAVQRRIGDGVRGLELPAGKMRLHD